MGLPGKGNGREGSVEGAGLNVGIWQWSPYAQVRF
jgi:hypothetical protein